MSNGRLGFTTGACAAAAAKAALLALSGEPSHRELVEIPFPNGERHALPIAFVERKGSGVEAAVVKDAGDDPDITDGAVVVVLVEWIQGEDIVVFTAGDGVGKVTKQGLSVPPGEPAINPGPRNMIRAALREVSGRSVRVTVSIPGGRELAQQTYNPRLGVVNGLSVLGTTGRVRPFSCQALRCSVVCELEVARANGVVFPVLVPGHVGERSAHKHLALRSHQVIEVGNEWGFLLERLPHYGFRRALLWGHPGKLAKLADGYWDTHSSRSGSPVESVRRIAATLLGFELAESPTTDGLFSTLNPEKREQLACALAEVVARAAEGKAKGGPALSVALVNMRSELLGSFGELTPWWKTQTPKS